ncbi:putative membrane protein [Mycobacterium xenopi 4042]|uniref:Putative membrane protein n=1 Tax=Mycobacterium xenopi 4042 TaxID=1299334 RepID=X8EF96_MYCXE|nr:putative membrane protein [Mycobacterium xenopi 3993]EUA78668.1 putative membrane protein [Mycobacterium xenopi 4042]
MAFVPALLMLVTFGLARLEARLANDTVTAKDVAEFLEQAEADDVNTLARDGMPEALDHMHRRQSERLADPRLPRSAATNTTRTRFTGPHSPFPKSRACRPAGIGIHDRIRSLGRLDMQILCSVGTLNEWPNL